MTSEFKVLTTGLMRPICS